MIVGLSQEFDSKVKTDIPLFAETLIFDTIKSMLFVYLFIYLNINPILLSSRNLTTQSNHIK